MSHFQIEIILWSRLDIPVNNKNDNKEHVTQSKLLLPYVYMIVLLVSVKSHACMRKCIISTCTILFELPRKHWAWQWNCGFDRRDQKRLITCMSGVKRQWFMVVLHKRLTIILFIMKLWSKEPLLQFLGILVMKFALALFGIKGIVIQLWQQWTQGISQPERNNDALVYHVCDVDYNKT